MRGPPAAYFLIAALALLPTAALRHAGLPATNSSYPFVTFALALLAALLLVRPLVLVAKRHDAPLKQLKDDLRDNWPWLATAAFLAVALPQTLDAATVIKRQIPQIMPYYADPALIRLEAALGFEPWQVTHAIFGPLTRVIDIFYAGWHFVHIAFGVWIIVARDPRFQLRAALAFQLSWLLLGGLLATVLSSVGPVFVDDFFASDHFAPLMQRLPDDLIASRAMDYLLSVRGSQTVGGGISAMPSLHVAIVVLIGLCFRFRLPRWQWGAWTYAGVIFVGSIHLGWHYASDGLVGALGAWAIWRGTGFIFPAEPAADVP